MKKLKRSARRTLRLPVSLGGRLPAMTADVSPSGCKLQLPELFLPGSQVHGFVLQEGAELPFSGEVVWAVAGNPQLSLFSSHGIRFTRISPELKALLLAPRRN